MKKTPFARSDFSVELAREWFAYDPAAGIVIRIKNPARGPKTAGQPAGALHKPSGFRQVIFRGVSVYEQQLVWALVKGYWTPHKLRHVDENRLNNRIENLREVTSAVDGYEELQTAPETMLPGVVPTASGKFKAQIYRDKMIYLGIYPTQQEAHVAYLRAKQVLHSPLNRDKPTDELLGQLLNIT
jgi:hypothetical protein